MSAQRDWEDCRVLLRELKKLANEKNIVIVTAKQPPPNGTHRAFGPVPAGPIIIDYVGLTPIPRKKDAP